MHVLVFPGWYPNKFDNLSGDFIQRHLQAIAIEAKVTVIIPVKDNTITKAYQTEVVQGKLTEKFLYYPSISSVKWLDNLLSFLRYNYLCITQAGILIKKENISLVHLYVLQKNQLVGVILQQFYKIRYVISEQSTMYVDGGIEKLTWIQKTLWKICFRGAASYHAVSHFLATNIKKKLNLSNEFVVIPNVVNSDHFSFKAKSPNYVVNFVHVSNMVYQKNVEGMLEAFAAVRNLQHEFILHLVGPITESLRLLIAQLGLTKHVIIWGAKSYTEVAAIMQQCDVFVFFTRFETFGCVIIEANACGLPVIVSDLPVTREIITEGVNGMFVGNENIAELTEKIITAIQNRDMFNPEIMATQTSERYNYHQVCRHFITFFKSIT